MSRICTRNFILRHDGNLYGYRKIPVFNYTQREESLNKFQVIDCDVVCQDKIKQNAFVILFKQMKIERLFAASNQQIGIHEKKDKDEIFFKIIFFFCFYFFSDEWIRVIETINQQTTPHLQRQSLNNRTQMVTDDNTDSIP